MIARIDDGDYQLAVYAARDKVATQEATVDRIGRRSWRSRRPSRRPARSWCRHRPKPTRPSSNSSGSRRSPAEEYASRQTLEQAQANRDQAAASIQSARAVIDAAIANVEVLRRSSRRLRARSRSCARRRPRPNAICPSPLFARRSTASSATAPCRSAITCRPRNASRAWCRSATSISTPISRRRSSRGCGPASRSTSASMRCRIMTSRARSPRWRRPQARCSRCCRRTMPPAISPRSCSGLPVRIRVPAGVTDQRVLRPGMSVVVNVNTKPGALRDSGPTSGDVAGRCRRGRANLQSEHAMSSSWQFTRPQPRFRCVPSRPRRQAKHGRTRADAIIDRASSSPSSPCAFGMFMAFLDIQIVSASLAGDPGRPVGVRRRNPLGADRLSDRRSRSRSRCPDSCRGRSARAPVYDFGGRIHAREHHVRHSSLDRRDDRLARAAGLHRRRHGADGVRHRLSDLHRSAAETDRARCRPDRDLAPTIGPTVGGYLTDALSWHWLFFINVVPGIIVTVATYLLVDFDKPDFALFNNFDWWGLISMAGFLGALEYVLEEGPRYDWFDDNTIFTCRHCLRTFRRRLLCPRPDRAGADRRPARLRQPQLCPRQPVLLRARHRACTA